MAATTRATGETAAIRKTAIREAAHCSLAISAGPAWTTLAVTSSTAPRICPGSSARTAVAHRRIRVSQKPTGSINGAKSKLKQNEYLTGLIHIDETERDAPMV